jgi:subtilase family serine protease
MTIGTTGHHDIGVRIDSAGQVSESNENNTFVHGLRVDP